MQRKRRTFWRAIFVGISSTGIYCRPVCRAKRPKAENCTFYRTAAQGEIDFRLPFRPDAFHQTDAGVKKGLAGYTPK